MGVELVLGGVLVPTIGTELVGGAGEFVPTIGGGLVPVIGAFVPTIGGLLVTIGRVLVTEAEDLPASSHVARPSKRVKAMPLRVLPSRPTWLASTSRRTHLFACGRGPM